MQDKFGRKIEYLRLSITDDCNLKCIYCMPHGKTKKNCSRLSPDDIKKLVGVLAHLGISKVRITGGEPLMRADICNIISNIASIPEIKDISLTTNGIKLADMAESLKASGLMRINISLDSLKPEVFRHITGGGNIVPVMEGIHKAIDTGLQPLKINAVLIKGENDSEIDDFIKLAENDPIDVRFIELMPIGRFGESNMDRIIQNSYIISAHPELQYIEDDHTGQPARYYKIQGYKGRIGFISPMSHRFCSCCNRIRLTCSGKLRTCLGNNREIDLQDIMLNQQDKLEDVIKKAIYEKPEGHNFNRGFSSVTGMNEIGG